MAQSLTEGTNLAIVQETTMGATVPPETGWHNLQPNSYGDFGASYTKTGRVPITKNRQLQKGVLTDADTALPFETDLTKDVLDRFLPAIFMGAVKHSGGSGQSFWAPTAAADGGGSEDSFAVAADGDVPDGTLIYSRGWVNAANNGLFVTTGTSGDTAVKVATATLVAETAPAQPALATLEVAGFQFTTGDAELDGSGNLVSSTKDLQTLGLVVGQFIYFPPPSHGAGLAFSTAGYYGFARVKSIAQNLVELDSHTWTVGSADDGSGKTIRCFFTRFCRNTAIDSADYLVTSFAAEVTYPNLGGVGTPEYEVMKGLHVDEWKWNLPLTNKATASVTLTGTKTDDITSSRLTGPNIARNAVCNLAVSTAVDLMHLRMQEYDETGISTDFVSLGLTFRNNVDPEKELGTLGADTINVGKFEVEIEAEVIFTNNDVINGIRDNRTVRMDVIMRNPDFGMVLDIPSMTLDSGGRKLEANKSVKITSKLMGFQDPTLGYTASASVFAYLPT